MRLIYYIFMSSRERTLDSSRRGVPWPDFGDQRRSRRDPIDGDHDGDVSLAGDAILGGEQLLQLRDATGESVEGERRRHSQCDREAHEHRHRHLPRRVY